MGIALKRIYLIATIFTVLIISVAVISSVMLMKPISDEPEGGDDDTTGPDDRNRVGSLLWVV